MSRAIIYLLGCLTLSAFVVITLVTHPWWQDLLACGLALPVALAARQWFLEHRGPRHRGRR